MLYHATSLPETVRVAPAADRLAKGGRRYVSTCSMQGQWYLMRTQVISLRSDLRRRGELNSLSGGRGGLGSWHFKSATNRTPLCTAGLNQPIEAVIMELKLLADVGLVGFPNAGKSTLLSSISAARPKNCRVPIHDNGASARHRAPIATTEIILSWPTFPASSKG